MAATYPIFYSFRRCPYAMRARLALFSAGLRVEHREILLRDKPAAFLAASPTATVPTLVEPDGTVIDESLDIMIWALSQNDPERWLDMPEDGFARIEQFDGPFKTALDHYKYASRYPDVDASENRATAAALLMTLEDRLDGQRFLFGDDPKLADMAILPFVRQFAHVDLDWFEQQPWHRVSTWLTAFKNSDRFLAIMQKHPVWAPPSHLDAMASSEYSSVNARSED